MGMEKNSRGDQDVHNEQLQAAGGSGVFRHERVRNRVLSVGRASEREVCTMCCWFFDRRIENNASYANERIEKYLEYRGMPVEERIGLMKGVYGGIIPKNEMTQKPFPYVLIYAKFSNAR